ncbi:MAG: Uma2 family endonuclease [Myxococcota bacterium]|nr:Uma2 family endonuclease [Myxococcota bacterium]
MALLLLQPLGTMVAMISQRTTDAPVTLDEHVPTADQIVVLRGMSWDAFEVLLAARGDRSAPRMAFLDGAVEIMSPSRDHEGISRVIGILVGEYCLAKGIPFSAYGGWTQKKRRKKAGLEPDECFVFDANPKRKKQPDLAIEVVWTSGGIEKLEIYRRLQITEVWFWEKDEIAVYVLEGDAYITQEKSLRLPDLDLASICRLAAIEPMSAAILEFRERLKTG